MSSHSAADVAVRSSKPLSASLTVKDVVAPTEFPLSETPLGFSLVHEIAFVWIICMAQLLTQAGLALSITPANSIADTFNVSDGGTLSWFPAAYSLTAGSFILIAGRIGDIYGHKQVFIGSFLWYSLWALIGGLSNYSSSAAFFIFCRAMQGMGPAFGMPSAVAILGRTYPPGRRKHFAFALLGAAAPNGYIFGSIFCSLLTKYASWPWAYYVMSIICSLCAVCAWLIIPVDAIDADAGDSQRAVFDYPGSVTGVAALIFFNVAWNQAPSVGWQTAYCPVFVVIAFIFFALFVYSQLYPHPRFPQPLLPRSIFSPEIALVLCCIACGWGSFGIWVFYDWKFLTTLRGFSPLLYTAAMSPVCVSGAVAALTTGFLLSRTKSAYILAMSMVGFCVGNILFGIAPVDQTYWGLTFVSIVLTPFGMDMSFPAANVILSDYVPKQHQGVAASLVNTVLNYSISIGLGIGGTAESRVNPSGAFGSDADVLRGYRAAYYCGMAISGIGIVCSALLILETRGGKNKTAVDSNLNNTTDSHSVSLTLPMQTKQALGSATKSEPLSSAAAVVRRENAVRHESEAKRLSISKSNRKSPEVEMLANGNAINANLVVRFHLPQESFENH